jgi:4-amino-4-deoxy-L-arabinose transferase-like glycosyltransferase
MTELKKPTWTSSDMFPAWLLAAAAIVLQMATNGRYGYFRDELYYLALSHHLAWGYVDLAPMAPFVLCISRTFFGESLHAIRLLPAVALGAEILITGLIARELGGKRFAVLLSCLAVLVAPVIVNNASRFSMNPFESLFWMGSIYFVLRAINHNQPQMLLWSGVLIGLGVENKHSTAFFLISLTAGILLTNERRWLRTKWLWMAAAIIILLALPNLIWQVQHGFPTWIDLSNVKKIHKNVELPTVAFLKQQVMTLLPINALVWIAGLGFLLFDREGKRYRVVAATYLVFLAIMDALHGKDYYLAPIYPMLFAAGGVFWQKLVDAHSGLRWMKVAFPIVLLILGVIVYPIILLFFRRTASLLICRRWALACRARRRTWRAFFRSISPTNSDGRKWSRRWPRSITSFPPTNERGLRFSRAITARPARSTSSGRATDCHPRSAPTRTTITGDSANTPARA